MHLKIRWEERDTPHFDVQLKSELYKKAISEHEKNFGSDELKRWEDALVKVAHLKGWERKDKGYGELSELVVGEVLCKLNARNVDVPEYLVEDHRQVADILEKLEVDSYGVRFLGIHGIGGIGKTVLAKVVFNEVSSHFDSVCFLNNVRESSRHGIIDVQKKLLSSIVGSMNSEHIKDIGDGMNWIKRACHNKKVLIVLDDLDNQEQLKKLAGKSNWFGSGSRIIFTTRNLEVLMTQVESSSEEVLNQPKGILAHEVHEMDFGQALQLFCKHAFRRDSPLEGYDHLAKKIVRRVGMLPLAVEVIGSFLYCHGSALEQHFDKRNLWEDTLKRLDDGPFKDVRDALMISYEGLENKHKEVFLDVACLFTNEDQTYPVIMWDDCNYHPHIVISVLHQRSLIKIGHDNKFWMHDQVRDLGRYIVLEEYPCKLSRVWIYEDAIKLLERKEINEDVKALCLTCNGCSRNFGPEESAIRPRVEGTDFYGNFWKLIRCRLSSMRMHIYWQLREIFHFKDVRGATMICCEGPKNKQKGEVLDIGCLSINENQKNAAIKLDEYNCLPQFSAPCLLSLTIIGHKNEFWNNDLIRDSGWHIMLEDAIEILKRIERNEGVKALSLTSDDGCSRNIVPEDLASLPDLRFLRVEGIDFFGNFENVVLKLCWLSWEVMHNKFFAENFHFASLVVLDLSKSNIEDDWDGWSQFQMTKKLKVLDLRGCRKLTRTPDFSKFVSLEILILADCVKLITIDCSIGKLELLKTLNIKGCLSLGKLPPEVGSLHSLKIVRDAIESLKKRTRLEEGRLLQQLFPIQVLDWMQMPPCPWPHGVGVWANLTRLCLHGYVGTMALLGRLDNPNFRSDITMEVVPSKSADSQRLLEGR